VHEFGQLHFQLVHHRKRDAVLELGPNGIVDAQVGIAQRNGSDAHLVVDELVAVHVPDVAALAALQVLRRGALGVLPRAFGPGLGHRSHDFLGAGVQRIRLGDVGVVFVERNGVGHG